MLKIKCVEEISRGVEMATERQMRSKFIVCINQIVKEYTLLLKNQGFKN